jgi:3-oxoacyl-[acyl-carrier protein] reductase
MELGLKGKVAIVTGAGSQIGFGKGIALALAKEGCKIVIADINLKGAKQTAADIEEFGEKAIAVKTDVTNLAEVNEMVKLGTEKFGDIDILVNNAGITRNSALVESTEDHWHINVETSLKGTWYCTRAVLPQMIKRKHGKIINLSSGAARIGFTDSALYLAAKSGIIGFTRALAVELGRSGINVNAVAPGLGDTGLWGGTGAPPETIKGFLATVPMGKITTPQDIGNMVVFLASDVSVDITGQTIQVDGGSCRV